MRKTLEELWHGNITPQTKQFNRGTRYDEALKRLCKNEEKLNALLDDKEKEIFGKYKGHKDELNQYTEEDVFITGFRLGARIIIESFHEYDGFFSEIDA